MMNQILHLLLLKNSWSKKNSCFFPLSQLCRNSFMTMLIYKWVPCMHSKCTATTTIFQKVRIKPFASPCLMCVWYDIRMRGNSSQMFLYSQRVIFCIQLERCLYKLVSSLFTSFYGTQWNDWIVNFRATDAKGMATLKSWCFKRSSE